MDSRFESDQQDGRGPKGSTPRPEAVARGLGWLSIALGLAELVAPRAMVRVAGVKSSAGAMRVYGLRELACGVGILASRNPKPFLWARVGGDALDLGTLAIAANRPSASDRQRATRAALSVACMTAFDAYAAAAMNATTVAGNRASPTLDYSNRTGFTRSPDEMRGAARSDFEIPRDMRTPEALAPFTRDATADAKKERRRAGSVSVHL
ncbi:hypothetical protein [Paraburkholderia fynbosensis]|uniref:Cyclase dehydrase n=1 Tax=Paraburkholderia fynbosensis TaxID=1200993 RepID=A0A6J5H2A1_9BURK|nr:hypothetical protein [Paraburkholderia fynbosensis]CAB3809466.1 hypothetical protein LMG27177_06814 [Paraburkholderia fynbosensis]